MNLKTLLAPPVFDDPDTTADAQLLHPILLSIALLMALTLPGMMAFAPIAAGRIAGAALSILVTCLGLLWLERRGRVRLASGLLLVVIWLSLTALIVSGPGINGPAFLGGHLVVIVLAGLLLGGRISVISAAASTMMSLLLLVAEARGLWSPGSLLPDRAVWAAALLLFWTVVMVQQLSARVRQATLAWAQTELAERQRAEVAERESREQFLSAFEYAPIGMALVHPDHHILRANRALGQMLGYAPAEMVGRYFREFTYPEDVAQSVDNNRRLFAGELEHYQFEKRYLHQQGHIIWVWLSVSAVKGDEGQPQYAIAQIQDITERKRNEEQLRQLNIELEDRVAQRTEDLNALNASQNRLQQQAAQLTTLNAIGRAVSALTDLDTTLQNILLALQSALSLDVFYVALYDVASAMVTYPIYYDAGRMWAEPAAKLNERSTAARAIATQQPFIANRTPAEMAALVNSPYVKGDRTKISASILAAPLVIGERLLGVVSVHSYQFNAYTDEHLTLLASAAYPIAIAIENARLYEAEQRRGALLEALHHTSLDISAQLDLPTLLQTIVEQSVRLLNGHMGELYLTRSDNTGLDLVVNHNLHSDYTVPYLHMGEGVTGHVAQTGQPLIVPDYQAWASPVPRFAAGPYRSILSAPILWRDQALGVINVVDDQPNRFGPDDVEVVRLLAAQAGVAIQTARLFEQTKQRAEEMFVLYAIGVALTSGQDLYHALRALVQEIRQRMVADVFYVVIYDETTDIVTYPLYLNLEDDLHLPQRVLSANPGLTSEVITTRRTLYLPDISLPEVQQAHNIVVIVDSGIHAYVGIPLLINDRIIGVLSVQARAARAYSDEQVRMLETLAAQVAITVEKSQLWEQLQQELAAHQRAEAEIRQLNAELEQRVQERTAQLEAANKELEAFSYTVSHDLRAPLRGMDGFSRILLEDYAAQLDAEGQRYLNRIRASTQRMSQLIDDLLAFSRLGRQALHTQTVAPNALIQSVLSELLLEQADQPVEWVVGDLPECQADPALLRQVFANLLGNALKYSRQRAPARIEVGWRQGAYFIHDNGAGFDMRYAHKLFGVFQRLHTDETFEGTGVGLAIVRRIIQRHGGRVWAEAQVDQGATFYFTLPNHS